MKNLALIKLVAIGDIAIVCRALHEISRRFDLSEVSFKWVIDQQLMPLAKHILDDKGLFASLNVSFVAFHSNSLFKSDLKGKLLSAKRLLMFGLKHLDSQIIILHRDKRYEALFFLNSTTRIERTTVSQSEHSAVLNCLELGLRSVGITEHSIKNFKPLVTETTVDNSITVLVGGAKNSRIHFEEKRWPYFSELVAKLNRHSNYQINLIGSAEDQSESKKILAAASDVSKISDLTGKLSLTETYELLKKTRIYVGVDSGPGHLAALAMRRPEQKGYVLFGPTDPKVWGPLPIIQDSFTVLTNGAVCSPCYKNDGKWLPCHQTGSKYKICMNDLSADSVYQIIAQAL